jgi:hypothetical protein
LRGPLARHNYALALREAQRWDKAEHAGKKRLRMDTQQRNHAF